MASLHDWVEALLPLLPSAEVLDDETLDVLYRRWVVEEAFVHPDEQAERLFSVISETRKLISYNLNQEAYETASEVARYVYDQLGLDIGVDVYLSNCDDREQHPIPEPLNGLADALIHMETIDAIMEQIGWDGLTLLFVNNSGSRLNRWREYLWRYDPPLAEVYEQAYELVYDRLQKSDTSHPSPEIDLQSAIPPELDLQVCELDARMEQLRYLSYLAVGQHYRDALRLCRKETA